MDKIEKDRIFSKIQKLMNMADGGTQHEAEIAARMAQKLLLKFNLTMEEVDATVINGEMTVGDELFEMGKIWKKSEGNWIVNLYGAVASNNLCRIITKPKYGWSGHNHTVIGKDIYVIGKMINVELVDFMCKQLIPRVRTGELNAWKAYEGWEKRGKYKRGYLIGCVGGISTQLYEQMKESKVENKNLNALIVVNDKLVDDYIGNKWPSLGKGRGSSTSSNDGYSKGRKDGRSMSIHKGVKGPSPAGGGLLNGK